MPQDFSHQNLRGRSFKGQNLNGADFSGADIRGADFSHALLIGANFGGAKAGLQRRWVVGLAVCSCLLAGLSGFFSIVIGLLAQYFSVFASKQNLIIGIITLIILTVSFIVILHKDLVAGVRVIAIGYALALTVALASATRGLVGLGTVGMGVSIGLTAAVVGAGFGAVAGAGAAIVGTLALTLVVIAGALTLALTLVMTIVVPKIGAGAGVIALTGAFTLVSAYIGWRSWAQDEKYALVGSFAVAFAAIGGTSFRGANLTNADFTQARLKSTDFRGAIVTHTCWYKTRMLDFVRPGKTYLQNAQLRQVLVTGLGQDKNFDRQDLRGVNFQGASLVDASFIGADLSGANLQDADLSRAKLVQTQLDETDLTGATLTGACIEDWGITSYTKLDEVRCEYVYMRLPTKEDPNPRRKPDNWQEKFEDGGFADFIQPLVDTLDLYHTQGITPRAIAISFQELAQNHPDAELEIVAMERRGKNFLLRVKTALGVNLSNLSAEYFSTYNQTKSLVEQEVQKLSARIDHRIISVENAVQTALQRPSYYSVTRIQRVDTMHNNPGGFSVGGSVGGDVNNVQGDNNRTVQGDNNQAVLGDSNEAIQRNQVGADPETSLTKDDVVKLLTELETLIQKAELPTDTKEEVTEDLSATKKAADKEEPNKKRALERLTNVAETLEKASKTVDAGQSLWSKARPIIVKVAGWLGAAAGSHLLGL